MSVPQLVKGGVKMLLAASLSITAAGSGRVEAQDSLEVFSGILEAHDKGTFLEASDIKFKAYRYIDGEKSLMSVIQSEGLFGLNSGVESFFRSSVQNVVDGTDRFYVEEREYWFQKDFFLTLLGDVYYSDSQHRGARKAIEVFKSPQDFGMAPNRGELGCGFFLFDREVAGGLEVAGVLDAVRRGEVEIETKDEGRFLELIITRKLTDDLSLRDVLRFDRDKGLALVMHRTTTPKSVTEYSASAFVDVGGMFVPVKYEGSIVVGGKPFRTYEVSIGDVKAASAAKALERMSAIPSGYLVKDHRFNLEYKSSETGPELIRQINQAIDKE